MPAVCSIPSRTVRSFHPQLKALEERALLSAAWAPDSKMITLASAEQMPTQRTQLMAFDFAVLGRSRVVAPPTKKDGNSPGKGG